ADACVDSCATIRTDAGFRVEHFTAGATSWARVVAADADGNQRASAWIPAVPGDEVILAAIHADALAGDDDTQAGRSVLLYVAGAETWLPVPNASPWYRLRSVGPVEAQVLD